MKPFNQKLNEDITQLKKLHALKDKTEFNKMKSAIMKRHSISKATVYRELKKDSPGSYDRKRSERPVTVKEIQMVRELLEAQCRVQDVISVMERKTGMPYSWDRIDKIREAIDNGQVIVDSEKPEADGLSLKIPLDKGDTGGFKNQPEEEISDPPKSPFIRGTCGEESVFGDNLRVFIDELMDADRIADGGYITVNIGGAPYRLSRRIVKDITMIITNYAECWLSAVQLKQPKSHEEKELLFQHLYINKNKPLSPIDELVKQQEAVLRDVYGPDACFDIEDALESSHTLPRPNTISELNRIRIFHLVAEKIRSAVSGSFITLKELKELNEINRYFKEYGDY